MEDMRIIDLLSELMINNSSVTSPIKYKFIKSELNQYLLNNIVSAKQN